MEHAFRIKNVFFVVIPALLLFLFVPYAYLAQFFIVGAALIIFLMLAVVLKQDDFDFLFTLFFVAFFARILVALFTYEFRIFMGLRAYFGDGWPYVYNGNIIANMWAAGIDEYEAIFRFAKDMSGSGALAFYDFWNAFVLFISDRNPLSLAFINCAAGALSVVFIYQTALEFCNRKWARAVAVCVAFWPSLFIWSTQNLKEPITCLLLAGSFWAIVKLIKKLNPVYIVYMLIFAVALRYFREPFFLLFYAVSLPSFLVFYVWIKFFKKMYPFSVPITILALILVAFLFYNHVNSESVVSFLKYATAMRSDRAYGNLAFMQNLRFTSIFGMMGVLPPLVFMILLMPFPWQISSVYQMLTFSEMLAYYTVVFFFLRGVIFYFKKNEYILFIPLFFIISACVIFSLFEGNIGTIFRHRATILPFMFILAAFGAEQALKKADL